MLVMGRYLKHNSFFFDFNNEVYLINNNVLDKKILKKESINLIVTSPPYNLNIDYKTSCDGGDYENYLKFSKTWMTNCYFWAKDECRFVLNIPLDKNKGGIQSVGADLVNIAKKVGWKYHTTIIWNESNISRRTAWGSWLSASAPYVIAPVELIVVFYKNSYKKTQGTKQSTITKEEFLEWTNGLWSFNGESKKRIGHPAPFPRELPKRAIKLFSYKDDIVLDPFCGSGTSMIEAFLNNRQFIGIEIDKSYCELAKNRFFKIIEKERSLF